MATASLPIVVSREGYLATTPDLVVEIRSRNDTLPELMAKAQDYLTAGVKIVWLVDPQSRSVWVYVGQSEPLRVEENEVLNAGEIIPGFQYKVSDLLRQ